MLTFPLQPHITTDLRTVKMVKRQRDNTQPTCDDEELEPKLKLVNYSDSESSDDEHIRPPPRKRRAMSIYSDDEDLTSYYIIKEVNEKRSRLF